MKILIMFILLLFTFQTAYAQDYIQPATIFSSGMTLCTTDGGDMQSLIMVGQPLLGIIENRDLQNQVGFLYGGKEKQVSVESRMENGRKIIRSIAPNPAGEYAVLSIQIDIPVDIRIEIITLMGQSAAEVFRGNPGPGNSEISMNASDLMPGVYFVRLSAEGLVEVKSFAVVR